MPSLTGGTPAGIYSSAAAHGRGDHFQAAAGSAGPRPCHDGGQLWWLVLAGMLPVDRKAGVEWGEAEGVRGDKAKRSEEEDISKEDMCCRAKILGMSGGK